MSKVPSVADLRTLCAKDETRYGPTPPISKYIIRPHVAIHITRLCLLAGINGDTVTLVMGLVGIAGTLLLLGSSEGLRLGGFCLLLASWVLDHVDGQVLTYHQQSSAYGILLDRISHVLEHPLMHFSLGWSLASTHPWFAVLGSANALAVLMIMAAQLEVDLLAAKGSRVAPQKAAAPAASGLFWRILRKLFGVYRGTIMIGYGPNVIFLFLLSMAGGVLPQFFAVVSFSLYLNLILSLWSIFHHARRARMTV